MNWWDRVKRVAWGVDKTIKTSLLTWLPIWAGISATFEQLSARSAGQTSVPDRDCYRCSSFFVDTSCLRADVDLRTCRQVRHESDMWRLSLVSERFGRDILVDEEEFSPGTHLASYDARSGQNLVSWFGWLMQLHRKEGEQNELQICRVLLNVRPKRLRMQMYQQGYFNQGGKVP